MKDGRIVGRPAARFLRPAENPVASEDDGVRFTPTAGGRRSDPYGSTRTSVRARHALLTPDGIVPSALPGWSGAACYTMISPAMGARFCQLHIELAAGGVGQRRRRGGRECSSTSSTGDGGSRRRVPAAGSNCARGLRLSAARDGVRVPGVAIRRRIS